MVGRMNSPSLRSFLCGYSQKALFNQVLVLVKYMNLTEFESEQGGVIDYLAREGINNE